MTALPKIDKIRKQTSKRQEKRTGKKNELADSAVEVLSQLGYARTSLRDIAQHSGISVGVLHYYFEDRVDLISYCTRRYKDDFARMLERTLDNGGPRRQIASAFINALVDAVENDADKHRLWYDIRAQALFDESFHQTIDEIETLQIDIIRRLMLQLGTKNTDPLGVFLALDGTFRHYLKRRLRNDSQALEDFRKRLNDMFEDIAHFDR
jgi:AcrR family transcriptional regulator